MVALRACQHGERTAVFGPMSIRNEGAIRIGAGVTFSRGMIATELVAHPGAALEIGDECVFNYAVSIEAHASVSIGKRCMLASFVRLCDAGQAGVAPIVVGDDVWIAHGAIIEPGVTIGEGSVVAAGSVVTRDVPPRSIAAGNPARSMSLALAGSSVGDTRGLAERRDPSTGAR
jgi:maltose O-acetyltransferase